MKIEIGFTHGTQIYKIGLDDTDALKEFPAELWEKLSLSKKARILSALGDIYAADYSREHELSLPEVAEQRIAEAKEKIKQCLK